MKHTHLYLLLFSIIFTACEAGLSDFKGSDYTGKGGSLARFTITGNNLYIVDLSKLKTFDISEPAKPVLKKTSHVGFQIETIFSLNKMLFMGSRQGMYIYSISNPNDPYQLSSYQHVYSCDPVVADDKYAYVTLSTGSGCRSQNNELQIIDIRTPESPYLLQTYNLTNPKGLAIVGSTLFVCDKGLKVYDASNPRNLFLKKHFSITANDIVPLDTLLLVIGDDKLYQYAFKNNEINLLSSLSTISSK